MGTEPVALAGELVVGLRPPVALAAMAEAAMGFRPAAMAAARAVREADAREAGTVPVPVPLALALALAVLRLLRLESVLPEVGP